MICHPYTSYPTSWGIIHWSANRYLEPILIKHGIKLGWIIGGISAAGYFSGGLSIPVIGVDATAAALDMIAQGTLYGTVQNDAASQAQAVIDLAALLAAGEEITAGFHGRVHSLTGFITDINSVRYLKARVLTHGLQLADDFPEK